MTTELPEGWEAKPLKDLCIGKGEYGANVAKSEFDPNLPRYIRITDIEDDGQLSQSSHVSIAMTDAASYILEHGDIVFARSGATVGKTYQYQGADGCCAYAGYLIRFKPNPVEIDPSYLKHYVRSSSYWRWIELSKRAQAQPNINAKEYGDFPVIIPPLSEQEQIAEVLSSVDEAIRATQAVIEQTRTVKNGLLQTLLTQGLGHTKFKPSPLGPIPEHWEAATLGDIAIDDGGLQTGPFGSQLKAAEYVENGVPVVMPKDLIDRRISLKTVAQTSTEKAATLSKHKLLPGDILFGRRGDIGRCGLVMDNDAGYLCGTGCLRARINRDLVSPEFLLVYLTTPAAISWLNENAVGQTMLNLNTSILASLPVALPPLSEQLRISNIFDDTDVSMLASEQKLTQLKTLKSGLMSDLLTGRVRVKGAA